MGKTHGSLLDFTSVHGRHCICGTCKRRRRHGRVSRQVVRLELRTDVLTYGKPA